MLLLHGRTENMLPTGGRSSAASAGLRGIIFRTDLNKIVAASRQLCETAYRGRIGTEATSELPAVCPSII